MISELKHKKKQIKAIEKVRESQLEEQIFKLHQIQKSYNEKKIQLRSSQQNYLQSVEKLNQARLHHMTHDIGIYDSGASFHKQEWIKTLRMIKELETELKSQLLKVESAQRDLKAVENLKEKNDELFTKELLKIEQNLLDEQTSMRLIRNNAS